MPAKLDGTNGLLQQYDYQTPTTGFSYTFAAGVNVLVMQPAGTLATGTITMPAAPADGMTITFSTTQTITALTVSPNTGQSIVRAPILFGAGSAVTYVYRLSNTTWYPMTNYATAGGVLQVVQATTDSQLTITGATYADITGLSASITPTSTSSKILVRYRINGSTAGATTYSAFQIVRNSTAVGNGAQGTNRIKGHSAVRGLFSDANPYWTTTGEFLDSPATVSATTYKIQTATNGTTYINRSPSNTDTTDMVSTLCSITLMEVAA